MLRRNVWHCLFAVLLALSARSASAVVINWSIQTASSSLTLSGASSSGGSFLADILPQSAGGLTATLGGEIITELDLGVSGPTNIGFVSAEINPNVSGNWDPLPGGNAGTSPADYGGYTGFGPLGGISFAIRDLGADLSSGVLPLSGDWTGIQDFAGLLDTTVLSAVVDFRGYGAVGSQFGQGSVTSGLAGQGNSIPTVGTITYGSSPSGLLATLSIPIDLQFQAVIDEVPGEIDREVLLSFHLVGGVVATAQVPEANGLLLAGLAGSILGMVRYRRSRRDRCEKNRIVDDRLEN